MSVDPVRDRSRGEARERALELAYEAEIRGRTVDELLDAAVVEPDAFTVELLRNEEARRAEAEQRIDATATGWTIDRMPVLDVVIMRLAVAELLTGGTPVGVVLAEAVALAARYSTDESSRFVNGVLAAIADEVGGGGVDEVGGDGVDEVGGDGVDEVGGDGVDEVGGDGVDEVGGDGGDEVGGDAADADESGEGTPGA